MDKVTASGADQKKALLEMLGGALVDLSSEINTDPSRDAQAKQEIGELLGQLLRSTGDNMANLLKEICGRLPQTRFDYQGAVYRQVADHLKTHRYDSGVIELLEEMSRQTYLAAAEQAVSSTHSRWREAQDQYSEEEKEIGKSLAQAVGSDDLDGDSSRLSQIIREQAELAAAQTPTPPAENITKTEADFL